MQLKDISMSTEMNSIPVIKRERLIGRRGGESKWPLWMVQLICELLLNGMPESYVPPNIASLDALIHGSKVKELLSLRFIRECHVVLKIIGETLTYFSLAKSEKWEQAFTYGISRLQISVTFFSFHCWRVNS